MRLAEGKDSWKAGGVIRKDERRDPSPPSRTLHRRKKNRKRWCRGREGVEHVWGWWRPGFGPNHDWLNRQSLRGFLGRYRCAYRLCETCDRVDTHSWWT